MQSVGRNFLLAALLALMALAAASPRAQAINIVSVTLTRDQHKGVITANVTFQNHRPAVNSWSVYGATLAGAAATNFTRRYFSGKAGRVVVPFTFPATAGAPGTKVTLVVFGRLSVIEGISLHYYDWWSSVTVILP